MSETCSKTNKKKKEKHVIIKTKTKKWTLCIYICIQQILIHIIFSKPINLVIHVFINFIILLFLFSFYFGLLYLNIISIHYYSFSIYDFSVFFCVFFGFFFFLVFSTRYWDDEDEQKNKIKRNY